MEEFEPVVYRVWVLNMMPAASFEGSVSIEQEPKPWSFAGLYYPPLDPQNMKYEGFKPPIYGL